MATYFHGAPEIQSDGLQTLYLMNPGYFGQSDAAAQTWSESLNPMILSHNPEPNHHHQHLVGIPNSEHPTSIHTSHEVSAVQASPHRLHYNLWNPAPSSNSIDVSLANSREVKDLGPSSSVQSVLMGSKYLKAAQRLLDDVVSFGNESKRADSKSPMKGGRESEGVGEPDTTKKQGANFTAAERQELRMKKAKLVNMMDEVEQRYRHYRNQMQLLVSSFESLAGFKSARTYTSLALQTISKQFRCLRDAISAQILVTSRSLGEEDHPVGGTKSASSRLGIFDPHNARQQQALQQLGMIQHNAWRPQRGLPERSVSVLRAWLFEHFLHPYPKDSDKHMLAMQTGLTRSQVSNWFINARVRLWKPMVEEMYLKEFKDEEENDASTSNANDDSASKSSTHRERSPTSTEQTDSLKTNQGTPNDSKFHPITNNSENHEGIIQPSPKRSRIDQSVSVEMKHEDEASNRKLLMKFMDGRSGGDGDYPSIADAPKQVAGFGVYTIGEIARFDHEQFTPRLPGNSVSLTLGLQHSENLPLSETQQSYIFW